MMPLLSILDRLTAMPPLVIIAAGVLALGCGGVMVLALVHDKGRIGAHTTFLVLGYGLALAAVATADHLPRWLGRLS